MKQALRDYVELTKPKVTLLNLLVGTTCFIVAAFPSIDWLRLTVFFLAGYLAAGGCGVLNCVYDRDIDGVMGRTSKRPIPSGRTKPENALAYGISLIAAGVAVAYYALNPLTSLMIILGTAFYLPVYTFWLKRSSQWNVVIGGTAGAFAGVAGWLATGSALNLTPILIGLLDFLWTPGHLWGLAIKKVKEYKKANVPMLPVTAGVGKASRIVFGFNTATVMVSFLPLLLGLAGLSYLAVAVVAGTSLLVQSRRLLSSPSEANGFRVFLASMPYLASVMVGLLVDKLVGMGLPFHI